MYLTYKSETGITWTYRLQKDTKCGWNQSVHDGSICMFDLNFTHCDSRYSATFQQWQAFWSRTNIVSVWDGVYPYRKQLTQGQFFFEFREPVFECVQVAKQTDTEDISFVQNGV